MKLAVSILLCAVSASSQSLTPKETTESQKLAFAIERERGLQLEFQEVQESIEPKLQPIRQRFLEQDKEVNAQVEAVKKQNNWGADVVLDKNPQSPTFGQFIHETKKPEPKK